MKRIEVLVLAASILAGCSRGVEETAVTSTDLLTGVVSGETRVVDLTYALNDRLPRWPGDERGFEARINASPDEDGYFTRSVWMLEHYGTHLDAPAHFPPGRTTVEAIPARRLIVPAVVIDARADAERDADFRLPPERIGEWEKRHGRIPRGSVVLLRTGWPARWPDEKRYLNQDEKGTMHFPGFSVEAARELVARGVSGLGADTPSVDYGASTSYDVHKLSGESDVFHIENLADLSELPESGAWLIVAPVKFEGGSGGPCRVFALFR
jgi:kynurenine formamidase